MSEIENEQKEEMTPEIFFGMLVSASMIVHIKHLRSKAYAEHMALGEFYEGAPEIADSIIETYQGDKEVLLDYDEESLIYGLQLEPIEYLQDLKSVIENNRFEIVPKECQHIHNELDNMLTLIDSTLYKLLFLK